MKHNSFKILLFLCVISLFQIKCDISQTKVKYSYAKIYSNSSKIFPQNLQFKVNLTYAEGLLIYAVDRNKNQLIIKLKGNESPVFVLSFRKKISNISLKYLCNCTQESCLGQILEFQFQVKSKLEVRCNGQGHEFEYPNVGITVNRRIDPEYLIPTFEETIYAHLFFINQPNAIYISIDGCISQIKYNEKYLNFTVFTETKNYNAFEFCTYILPILTNVVTAFSLMPTIKYGTQFYNGTLSNVSKFMNSVQNKLEIIIAPFSFLLYFIFGLMISVISFIRWKCQRPSSQNVPQGSPNNIA